MQNEFGIYFSYNGTHFKAAILEKDRGADSYFRVEYKTAGLETPPKIIFVRLNEDDTTNSNPFWEQCPGTTNPLEEEFISAIGECIEAAALQIKQQ